MPAPLQELKMSKAAPPTNSATPSTINNYFVR